MNFTLQPASDEEKLKLGDDGILKIGVPHWATELQIQDGSLGAAFAPGKIIDARANPADSEPPEYFSELPLPVGPYRVTASLEGQSEEKWVRVAKGQVTEIPPKAWNKLEFTSAVPLAEVNQAGPSQMEAAAAWSGERTWRKYRDGGSSLFLFLRAAGPRFLKKNPFGDVRLLSADGGQISDFSESVVRNDAEGWAAFNSELRDGGYLLLSGGGSAQRRFQPVYLCRGWQTQIFLEAGKNSLLANASVNMTRFESRAAAGFGPHDETAVAAEAALNYLRYGGNESALFNNDRIEILFEAKTENPWLGILAVHAIHKLKKQTAGGEPGVYDRYFELSAEKILPFLAREIGSHPDVRALLLDQTATTPDPLLGFPPMLWRSLEKIYEFNAARQAIRPDSLLACLTDQVLCDSPWTAWRNLTRLPVFDKPPKNKTLLTVVPVGKPARPENLRLPAIIPKAPVYRLPVLKKGRSPALKSRSALDEADISKLLDELPPVQKSKQLVVDYLLPDKKKALPLSVPFSVGGELEKLLDDADPAEISRRSSLSTAEAGQNIEQLKAGLGTTAQSAGRPDPAAQQAVIFSSLIKSDLQLLGRTLPSQTDSAGLSLLEIINRLKTERARILQRAGERKIYGGKTRGVKKASAEIGRIITGLLKMTEYVLVSGSESETAYSSGAFTELAAELAAAQRTAAGEIAKIWTGRLRPLVPGLNRLTITEFPPGFKKWTVRRVLLEPDRAGPAASFYLDVLHLGNQPVLDLETVRRLGETVSRLANYSSFMAYGAENKCEESFQKLMNKIDDIKGLIERFQTNADSPVESGEGTPQKIEG